MSSETKEDEDDGLFLEQLLDHFYEFDNGPAPKQQKKKKKRKRCEEEEELTAVKDICPSDTEDCGAAATATEQQHQQPNAEPTGTTVRQVSRVEVVTFQDPRKKLKTKRTPAADKTPAPPLTEKKQSDQHEAIDFEKARLDVHRFGITGYKKEQQRVFEQDRAIMLGARPPKKDCVNYKLLQQQVKEKKQKAKEEVQPVRRFKPQRWKITGKKSRQLAAEHAIKRRGREVVVTEPAVKYETAFLATGLLSQKSNLSISKMDPGGRPLWRHINARNRRIIFHHN
ncbi:hypothetical protein F2P81_024453 [Scophthalmus maximus]|uniref:Uncharacterized protein n=1 Tax=Scophthalmus maximus TaxID=52904 RepID=A0A6A4RPI6_SCOMX|nr:hypothetical protein F2P81_024453 [Scophthalmus maximus]